MATGSGLVPVVMLTHLPVRVRSGGGKLGPCAAIVSSCRNRGAPSPTYPESRPARRQKRGRGSTRAVNGVNEDVVDLRYVLGASAREVDHFATANNARGRRRWRRPGRDRLRCHCCRSSGEG